MTDFRAKLDALMSSFLAGQMSFDDFQRAYSACYIDEEADTAFSPEEVDHYGVVHEKAEWTTPAPTEEERRYGWVTPAEFREWLTMHELHKPPAQPS